MCLDDEQIPQWTTPSADHLVGQRRHRRHLPDFDPAPGGLRDRPPRTGGAVWCGTSGPSDLTASPAVVADRIDARVATIIELARLGYADRMVLSHDASCRTDWSGPDAPEVIAAGKSNWHHDHISDDVLPALRVGGVTDAQIDATLLDVPRRYFGG